MPSSTEHALPTRPWHRGPWRLGTPIKRRRTFEWPVRIDEGWIGRVHTLHGHDADADLIALAPDMAELILSWAGSTQAPCDSDEFDAMAAKLRAIGGTS